MAAHFYDRDELVATPSPTFLDPSGSWDGLASLRRAKPAA